MKFLRFIFLYVIFYSLNFSTGLCQTYSLGANIFYASENSNVKGRLGFEATIDVVTNSIFALRGSIGGYRSDAKVNIISEGDYSLLWIESSLLVKSKSTKVQPYVGLGIGFYKTGHDLSPRLSNALNSLGFRVIEDIGDKISIHLRGGLCIPISSTISIDADVKYLFLKPDVVVTLTDLSTFESISVSDDIDLSTLFIGLGVSFIL